MKTRSTFAAIAMLSVISCTVEPMADIAPATKGTSTIKATVEQHVSDAAVRSAIDASGAVVWSAGDSIRVYSAADPSIAANYVLSAGEGTSSASFSGDGVEADETVAVYPAPYASGAPSKVGDNWEIPVSIPSVQVYSGENIPEGANLAVAVGGDELAFRNVMGVIRIPLYATSAYKAVRIQIAAAEPLAGDALIRYDGNGEPTLEFTGNTSKVLTIDLGDGLVLSKDASKPNYIYAVVPAGAFKGGLTVGLATASVVGGPLRTTKDNTIKRSVIHNMPDYGAAMSFVKYIKDLSNTYIVNPGDKIRIYSYRPDGNLIGHVKSGGYSAIAYYSAVSSNPVNEGTSITNYVSASDFQTSTNEGNVVIAAKDNDGILWSWTIWITDTPEDVTLKDGTVIMDRNLGATAADIASVTASSTETRGLRYQWGRKDPCFNVTTSNVVTSAEVGTVEYAIANPTKFIIPAEGSANAGDWHWKGDNTLWGATKTIYDPCPAGYQIPCGGTGTASIWAANDFASNKGAYDSTNAGYSFSVTEEGALWFPAATYNKYDSASSSIKTYSGGHYWCYNSVGMTSGSYNGRVFKFTSTEVKNSDNQTRAAGCSIRCAKIK